MKALKHKLPKALGALIIPMLMILTSTVVAEAAKPVEIENKEIITLGYNLRTSATDRFIDEMRSWATSQGGYLVSMQSGIVIFRIPVSTGKSAIDQKLHSIPGVNVYRAFRQNNDVSVRIVDQKAKLKVAEKNLIKLRELSGKAGLDDLLELERALNRSLSQVERLKGEISYLERSAALFNLSLHINNTGHTSDSKTIPIPWIRSLTIQGLTGAAK